jgi:hypothetical protein
MNQVNVTAKVASKFTFSHEIMKEKFYNVILESQRISGAIDIIYAQVSERIFDVSQDLSGEVVSITGTYRSYNKERPNGLKSILILFADEIKLVQVGSENNIELDGFICKEPIFRNTKTNRRVTELLVACNRSNTKKSDYFPVITWGRNADYASELRVGDHISITGRIQSRDYEKNDTTYTVNEISVYSIGLTE